MNAKIAYLRSERKVPDEVQQVLDAARVVGNEAVHPGQIDIRDNAAIAQAIASALNLIAHYLITGPRKAKELYEKLPETKRLTIKNRDQSSAE